MRSIKSLAIGAGFGFVTLAIFVQGFLPAILPESRTKRVSRAVRTDLGEIKWVRYESSDYTPLEELGRAVYIREGCWYCHSQSVRPRPDGELPIDGTPVLDLTPFGDKPPALTSVLLVVPTKELVGLVRYVQKLGTNRGAWREVFEPQNVAFSVMRIPQSADLVARGEEEYAEHCIGCHGAKGDGNGLAATFLFPRPRDFPIGAFQFRSTPTAS